MFKLEDAVGNTPLVLLKEAAGSRLFAKVEFMNPGGSIKDRAAFNIVRRAFESGKLAKGGTVIEATSGNMGIGFAIAANYYGVKAIFTMPENMSLERRKIMTAYGAQLVLTPVELGMKGALERAALLEQQIQGSYFARQFDNPYNREAHYLTTAPEIFRALPTTAYVVVTVGSGGTIMGTKDYVTDNAINAKIVAVEPKSSAVLSGNKPSPHKIQGIGAGFIPPVVEVEKLDMIQQVSDEEAYEGARILARRYGLLAGISSGAAYVAGNRLFGENRGDIVIILPDSGGRYLSGDLFDV